MSVVRILYGRYALTPVFESARQVCDEYAGQLSVTQTLDLLRHKDSGFSKLFDISCCYIQRYLCKFCPFLRSEFSDRHIAYDIEGIFRLAPSERVCKEECLKHHQFWNRAFGR